MAWNRTWAGLHLTASPVDLSGYYTRYKDNGDRQPYIDRTLPLGALVQDQLLEWMKAYHLWATYDKKTTLRVYPYKIPVDTVKIT